MGAIAEGAFLEPCGRGREILINLEINRICQYSCPNCVIRMRNINHGDMLNDSDLLQAAEEALSLGSKATVVAAGMEPTLRPDLLFEIAKRHARMTASQRPSLGMITNGICLPQLATRLAQSPLDWIIVSANGGAAGLHPDDDALTVVRNAIALRNNGGCRFVAVNTVAADSITNIMKLGREIADEGVNQWYIGSLLVPRGDQIVRSIESRELWELAYWLGHNLGSSMKVLIDVGWDSLLSTADDASERTALQHERGWRAERRIGSSNVYAMAMNPWGRFARLQWNGFLISHQEFLTRGRTYGVERKYVPGRLHAFVNHNDSLKSIETKDPVLHMTCV